MINTKNNLNGWLVINKSYDMGSTQVVGRLKHLLHPAKIGHAGTLDPLATGVLPIALGKATRLIPFVMDDKKTYEFTIRWGIETDSDDLAGKTVATCDVPPDKREILSVLPQFRGQIMQTPNAFSAIKINGQRAYDLARSGKDVVMKPRPVMIYDLQLLKVDKEKADFVATVGKGTYIRTLVHDIAHALNTLGVVVRLHRTKDGPFDITQSVLLDDDLAGHILPMEDVLPNLPKLKIDSDMACRVRQGQRIKSDSFVHLKGIYALMYDKKLVALAEVQRGVLHPKSVF